MRIPSPVCVIAFAYFDGVSLAIVSDNLRAVVTKAHKYAPVINKTFQDFARHYDCVIDPARPYHPPDKALVERSVTLVYQRIYYPLSKSCNRLHKTLFFTISDFFDLAKLKRIEGAYLCWSCMLAKVPLLVLDDFAATPIDAPSRQLLMEIVDKRYEKCSVIITSQIPVAGWH